MNVINRLSYKNKVFAWLNNIANSLKRRIFSNKLFIVSLNKENIAVCIRANIKQKTNFEINAIIQLGGLVIKNGVIA